MPTNSNEENTVSEPTLQDTMGSSAILSNEEVDALLSAIHEGQVLLGQTKGPKQHWKLQHYDFRRPERFPKEERRKFQRLNENVSKSIGVSLSKYLRTSMDFHLISIEELTYEAFAESCEDLAYVNVLDLQPMNGLGSLILDLRLCFAIIDKGLGGAGSIIHDARPLTNVESAIIDTVVESILSDMRMVWEDENVLALDWKVQKKEFEPKAVQLMRPTEIILSIKFASSGDLGFGGVTLCLPFQALKPVLMGADSREIPKEEEYDLIRDSLEKTELELTAILGGAEVSIRELSNLQPGSVIVLDNKIYDETLLNIDGKTKFYGRPGLMGKKKAVEIVY